MVMFVAVLSAAPVFSAQKQQTEPKKTPPALVSESFAFIGIEGVAKKVESSDKWFFTPDSDAANEVEVFKAGTSIELLPCSTLEQIAANSTDGTAAIRIWGRTTRYSNKYTLTRKTSVNYLKSKVPAQKPTDNNFLFPVYFIPLNTTDEEAAPEADVEESQEKTDSPAGKDSILPDDVMKLFKPKRVIKLTKKIIDVEGDLVTANRTGFVSFDNKKKLFSIDGLGRNVDGIVFNILPCRILETIEKKHASRAGRLRFKVSGIVTKYKGQYYVLLQRAVRTYNHGNFAR